MSNTLLLSSAISRIGKLEAERDGLLAERDALKAAANALIDFCNGPLDAKRPDVFQILMQRLANAVDGDTK